MECPCGSGDAFSKCCEPIIKGKVLAETAEALMRSRYSAYVTCNIDHLRRTLNDSGRNDFDADAARDWAESADWQELEVLSVDGGGPDDDDGVVEFVARYVVDEQLMEHHERASFSKKDGQWEFDEGRVIGCDPYRRDSPKVGRNEPCVCGSGKKYKKCCGR
jgi:SEC-C motif-containing protein